MDSERPGRNVRPFAYAPQHILRNCYPMRAHNSGMVKGPLNRLFAAIRQGVTGYVDPADRLHPDFTRHDGNRWFYNDHLHNSCCRYFEESAQKLRIFLNEDDMPRFNNCPYPAKLGRVTDNPQGYAFCAFLYAMPGDSQVEDLTAWAKARGFSRFAALRPAGAGAPALQNA